jgi:hypothetical protein
MAAAGSSSSTRRAHRRRSDFPRGHCSLSSPALACVRTCVSQRKRARTSQIGWDQRSTNSPVPGMCFVLVSCAPSARTCGARSTRSRSSCRSVSRSTLSPAGGATGFGARAATRSSSTAASWFLLVVRNRARTEAAQVNGVRVDGRIAALSIAPQWSQRRPYEPSARLRRSLAWGLLPAGRGAGAESRSAPCTPPTPGTATCSLPCAACWG